MKYLQIKHGRVAMMAVLGILVAENFHPFYGGSVGGPAISHFSQIDKIEKGFWLVPFLAIGSIEAISIATTWAPRKDTKGTVGWLKDNHTPGDLGFDPLGLSPEKKSKYSWNEIRTKELQNGRLAMLAVAGIVAQELVDGKTVLGHLVGPLVEI